MRYMILEFSGGAWDGMNLCNCSDDPIEAGLARHVAKMTGNCKSGHIVALPHEYAVRCGGSVYRITAHALIGDESLVRLECCDEACVDGQPGPPRTLVLQFSGGALDGRTLRSDSADIHEALLATACLCLSAADEEAQTVKILPAAWRRLAGAASDFSGVAEYRVTARIHDQSSITVALVHQPGSRSD